MLSPPDQAKEVGRTPTLTWTDRDPHIFSYEVQVPRESDFVADPALATHAVYWELVHGGQTQPLNSYTVPLGFTLEPGTVYYWRVRPRVQGDGTPVSWSPSFSFPTDN